MKGNTGLEPYIIHYEINEKIFNSSNDVDAYNLNNFKSMFNRHSDFKYIQYTNILPYKQLYEPIITEENNIFCHKFILTNNTEKFLVLKELYLMAENLTTNEFFPSITKILHHVDNKFILNDLDGISLIAINLFVNSNNKYSVKIPIISSYGVINYLKTTPIELKIFSTCKLPFKILATFNQIVSTDEIDRFTTMEHEYLNTSFMLTKFNVNKGNNLFVLSEPNCKLFCKSLILLVETAYKNVKIKISTNNFNYDLNLTGSCHKFIGNKIAFLITNSHDNHVNCLYKYQPNGLIEGNEIKIELESENQYELSVILQEYNIIKITQ